MQVSAEHEAMQNERLAQRFRGGPTPCASSLAAGSWDIYRLTRTAFKQVYL